MYVTGSTKTSRVHVASKLKSILLCKIIATLKKYPCTVSLVDNNKYIIIIIIMPNVSDFCFSGGYFADPVMSRLREWHLQRAPIGWPYPGTAAIAC